MTGHTPPPPEASPPLTVHYFSGHFVLGDDEVLRDGVFLLMVAHGGGEGRFRGSRGQREAYWRETTEDQEEGEAMAPTHRKCLETYGNFAILSDFFRKSS